MKSSWDGLRRSFIERTHALNDALSRTAIAEPDDAKATRASASSDDDGTTTRDDDDEGRRATTPGALLKRALRRGTKRATPTRETGRDADAVDAAERLACATEARARLTGDVRSRTRERDALSHYPSRPPRLSWLRVNVRGRGPRTG